MLEGTCCHVAIHDTVYFIKRRKHGSFATPQLCERVDYGYKVLFCLITTNDKNLTTLKYQGAAFAVFYYFCHCMSLQVCPGIFFFYFG